MPKPFTQTWAYKKQFVSQTWAGRKARAARDPSAAEKFKRQQKRANKKKLQKNRRNPELTMWRGARGRAKKAGLNFTIEVTDICIPTNCPILGIPLYPSYDTKGGPRNNSPTLDRINNAHGYVKGNVAVISMKANALKNALTPELLDKLLKYMENSHS